VRRASSEVPAPRRLEEERGGGVFQVKATVVGFLGNMDLYPCHFKHRVGDEVVFDGESYHGRLCPDVWPLIAPKVAALHQAGPRHVEALSFYPFWYCPPSVPDPSEERNDGLGFKNVLETIEPPPHDMANLGPPGSFNWPPRAEGGIARTLDVVCPDSRSSMVVRLEAFDLSEKGFDTPYFRRQMAILAKLKQSGATDSASLLDLFTAQEIEGIYPALSKVMLDMLADELQLMGYIETAAGRTTITGKGEVKLKTFREGLPPEHREAFENYVR
jgi:uncharacterized repeat protein (TIGR04076 family)